MVQDKKQDIYNLYDLYLDSGWHTNAKRLLKTGITKPSIEIMGDTIGLRFDENAGIFLPQIILPLDDKELLPFSLSLGITFTQEQLSTNILNIVSQSEDANFALAIIIDQDSMPVLYLKANNQEYYFPCTIEKLEADKRYFFEFFIIPNQETLDIICTVDHEKSVSYQENLLIPDIKKSGTSLIGGEDSVIGIIDTLDIFPLSSDLDLSSIH